MGYASQPIRQQLFIPPTWKNSARRTGPMMAYDTSLSESRRAHDAEPVAEPGNADAIQEILAWISQNLSPDETAQLYNEIGKLDATGPSDQSKNEQMRMQESESRRAVEGRAERPPKTSRLSSTASLRPADNSTRAPLAVNRSKAHRHDLAICREGTGTGRAGRRWTRWRSTRCSPTASESVCAR